MIIRHRSGSSMRRVNCTACICIAAVLFCSCIFPKNLEQKIGIILDIKGKSVRISLGAEEGARKGAVFGVYSVTQVVRLPIAGEVSLKREKEIGKLEIIDVDKHESTASVIATADNTELAKGMTVIQLLSETSENTSPVIRGIESDAQAVEGGRRIGIVAAVSDPEGDPFHLEWSTDNGKLEFTRSRRHINSWVAPVEKCSASVKIKAIDVWGNASEKVITLKSKGQPRESRRTFSLWRKIGRDAVPAGSLVYNRITCDEKGDLYVLDISKNGLFRHLQDIPDTAVKISQFEEDGKKRELDNPCCFDVTPTRVYVVDGNNYIRVFNKTGEYHSTLGSGKGSEIGYLNQPVDIEVDRYGSIYVADKGNRCIEVLDDSGISRFRSGQIGEKEHEIGMPAGIELSPRGDVYVLDAGNKKVLTLSPAMEYISSFQVEAEGGLELVDMAFNAEKGLFYILDSEGERVLVYTGRGKHIDTLQKGTADTWKHVQKPSSVCIGPFGGIYIGSGEYNRISRYTDRGALSAMQSAELVRDGAALCASSDRVFLLEDNYYQVRMFDCHGWCLNTFGGNSKKGGSIGKAAAMAADDTYVYVLDTYYHNIHKYTHNGKEVAQIGDKGKEPGKFIEPADIALDKHGSLYVLDRELKRISIFNTNGDLVRTFSNSPANIVQMDEPGRIAVSRDGTVIYVYDSDLYTIIKYNSQGEFISHYGQKGADEIGQFYYVDFIGTDEAGCLIVGEPRYNRLQKVDFRGAGGKPCVQYYKESALSENADIFTVNPNGIIVIYDEDGTIDLME